MAKPDFDKLFTAAAMQLHAAFVRSSSGNRPDEMGEPREKQFKSFLGDWLPQKFGLSKGYILNAEKEVSGECDLVIFNSETCPKFYFDQELNVARGKIFRYIETWYNRMRKHSALQYLSPSEYEFEMENISLTKAA